MFATCLGAALEPLFRKRMENKPILETQIPIKRAIRCTLAGYTIKKTLGTGMFSKVKLGEKDGKLYCLKILKKQWQLPKEAAD